MALNIFGGEAPAARKSTTVSDVVGRFRSGYQTNDRPVALSDWRVTTGDPEVADKLAELLGAPDGVKPWDATGEDNLEVFTEASEVEIIIEGTKALRQAMVMYGRKGILYVSDGETISYPEERAGDADPQAGQTFQERKAADREGSGASPRIELWFRLASDPDLGLFKFQTGSWSLVSDLAYNGTEDEIADFFEANEGEQLRASLTLEPVEFIAKSGKMKGQTVSFTKPILALKGKA